EREEELGRWVIGISENPDAERGVEEAEPCEAVALSPQLLAKRFEEGDRREADGHLDRTIPERDPRKKGFVDRLYAAPDITLGTGTSSSWSGRRRNPATSRR